MAAALVSVRGMVNADGTLELEAPVSLSAGPVQVTIQPVPLPRTGGSRKRLLDVLDEIHADQRARGFLGRSDEEIAADEALRLAEAEEYEERWRTIWGRTASERPSGESG